MKISNILNIPKIYSKQTAQFVAKAMFEANQATTKLEQKVINEEASVRAIIKSIGEKLKVPNADEKILALFYDAKKKIDLMAFLKFLNQELAKEETPWNEVLDSIIEKLSNHLGPVGHLVGEFVKWLL